MGADVICYPIVKDVKQDLANALEKAVKTADIVIINGGSSKGGEDYIQCFSENWESLYNME